MASPSRLVNNTRYLNVTTRFASFKMGEVIQSESHTCELPFLCQLELDDDVVAVYDQPPPLFVEFPDSRGRLHRGNKTPDFLVIRRQRVEIYECKPGNVLRDLAKDRPHTWSYDGGAFRYFPAEKPAHELGFEFLVHNGDDISAVLATNLKLLVNVRRAKINPLDERQLAKARRVLGGQRALTLCALANALRIDDVSSIIASILAGTLFALTRWQPLSTVEGALVYASRSDAEAAEDLLITASECDCLNARNFQAPLALSPKAMNYTKRAIEVVRQVRSGEMKPDRKAYRLLAKLRQAAQGQSLLHVLSPAFHRRGAKTSLGPEIEGTIDRVIRDSYSRAERPSISAAYLTLLKELGDGGLTRISYETFRQRIRVRPKHDLLLERQGVRAANAIRPPVLPNDVAILATYAWERAHIDSTLLDEETWLGCPLSKVLARPTIYILVDELSSKILAFWCCFANAGRQALACLLRDCIRRHQKLPCSIVHDLGPEFLSVFHETFCATFLIDLNRRPSRAPRWGAHVESAFNRINKLIAHRLSGKGTRRR
jgi:putative transposase